MRSALAAPPSSPLPLAALSRPNSTHRLEVLKVEAPSLTWPVTEFCACRATLVPPSEKKMKSVVPTNSPRQAIASACQRHGRHQVRCHRHMERHCPSLSLEFCPPLVSTISTELRSTPGPIRCTLARGKGSPRAAGAAGAQGRVVQSGSRASQASASAHTCACARNPSQTRSSDCLRHPPGHPVPSSATAPRPRGPETVSQAPQGREGPVRTCLEIVRTTGATHGPHPLAHGHQLLRLGSMRLLGAGCGGAAAAYAREKSSARPASRSARPVARVGPTAASAGRRDSVRRSSSRTRSEEVGGEGNERAGGGMQ